jgi:anti-anti-sigma regulatory factor
VNPAPKSTSSRARAPRFLLAALQEHLPAGQGHPVGPSRGPLAALESGWMCWVIAIAKFLSSRTCYGEGRGPLWWAEAPRGQPATTGGWAMEIQHSTTDGCQVVALTGDIDLFSVSQIQRALLKDLSEEPYALICDLSGVQELDPVCATVFATVANHPSSRWPGTGFLLCCAQPSVADARPGSSPSMTTFTRRSGPDLPVRWTSRNFLALGEVVPADVDAVGIGVVAEGDGNNVGHAVLADPGQPPEPLAPEILDLGVAERAHGVLLSGL